MLFVDRVVDPDAIVTAERHDRRIVAAMLRLMPHHQDIIITVELSMAREEEWSKVSINLASFRMHIAEALDEDLLLVKGREH